MMAEINATKWNGYKVASLFAGCGGSSLGYRMAGFRVVYANEFVPAALSIYRANKRPFTALDDRDIRKVTPESLMEMAGVEPGELDVLDGSPPCASFSTAGKRQRTWGTEQKYSDTTQRTDDLFFEYARILKGVQPRAFIAENVSGLVKGVAKGYFIEITQALKACGYRVESRLLDAQWLGVPQARQRIIFMGLRDDLDADPAFPTPLRYRYTIREAMPWIDVVTHGNFSSTFAIRGEKLSLERPAPTMMAGHGQQAARQMIVASSRPIEIDHEPPAPMRPVRKLKHAERDGDIKAYAIGTEWAKLAEGQNSGKYINLTRSHRDKPSPTVTASGGYPSAAAVTHPTEQRKFTIAELRRICAFPDDMKMAGTYAEQWERFGRAVPPVMMFHIASALRGVLDEHTSALAPLKRGVESGTKSKASSRGKRDGDAGSGRLDVPRSKGGRGVRRSRPRAAAVV